MEAAALYAFAQARGKSVVCFAHVTNSMGQIEGDFDKGEATHPSPKLTSMISIGSPAGDFNPRRSPTNIAACDQDDCVR